MGKRGPKPKPTAIKIARGTYRADRDGTNAPKPTPQIPSMPDWLGADAKREWKRVVKELSRIGMLTTLDRTALAMYCQAFGEYLAADRIVRKEGITCVRGNGSVGRHPATLIRSEAWARVCRGAASFGMDPSARSRINVDEPDDRERRAAEVKAGGDGGKKKYFRGG